MKDTDESASAGAARKADGRAAFAPAAFDVTAVQVRAKVIQDFAADVNRIAAEAVSGHADVVSASQQRLAETFQDLAKARQPPELMAAQARLVQSLIEGVADHAAVWSEQARKLGGCCAALVRDSATAGEGDGAALSKTGAARRSDTTARDRRSEAE